MKKKLLLPVLILISLMPGLYAQESAQITAPKLKQKNDNIVIIYDILNSTRRDLFDIWIEVTDTAANEIEAESLSGDIGENVKGGSHRVIVWDMAADNVVLDAGIYIQVFGESLTPTMEEMARQRSRPFNPYLTMGESLLIPGWGLAGLGKSKLHLLKGVAGYGCFAGSIIFNRMGIANLDKYNNPDDPSRALEYYNLAVQQDKISEGLAYAGIGIWVIDLTWTYLTVSKISKSKKSTSENRIRMHIDYDMAWQTPTLGLRYTF